MVTRHSLPPAVYFFPQPTYLVGAYLEDGRPTFAMHTWMTCAAFAPPTLMFSVFGVGQGVRRTADSVVRSGAFSVNLVTPAMLPYADYCGSISGYRTDKVADRRIPCSRGICLEVPVLDESPWVYECRLVETKPVRDCTVFFGQVEHLSVDGSVPGTGFGEVDIPSLDPVVYNAPAYYRLGPRVYAVGESIRSNMEVSS